MTETVIHICASCDRPHHAPTRDTPEGWSLVRGFLKCDDCHSGEPATVETAPDLSRCETAVPLRSGSYLDLANPDFSVIQPIDIAAGLRQPRFCAQTRDFYTVAQHSMLVLQLVGPVARKLGGDKGLQLRRCALMHDAAEAFVHDIVTPLKRQLKDYRAIERRIERGLADRFGWTWTSFRHVQVKQADIKALAIEQRDLVGRVDPWPIFEGIDREALANIKIRRAWHPDEAQDRFLMAFETLFPSEERKAA